MCCASMGYDLTSELSHAGPKRENGTQGANRRWLQRFVSPTIIKLVRYLYSDVGTERRLNGTSHGNHLLLHLIRDTLRLCKACNKKVRAVRDAEMTLVISREAK